MKKKAQYGMLAVAVVLLTACTRVGEEPSKGKTTVEEVKTTVEEITTQAEDSKVDLKEQYQSVFSDYEKVLVFARDHGAEDYEGMASLPQQLTHKISYWSVEGIVRNPDKFVYAFYDLDGNGQEELFVGSRFTEGEVYPSAFFYMKDGEPTLLAESIVAGHGGARAAVTFYKDGSISDIRWSSGTGDAEGVVYQLQKDNTEAMVVRQASDFKVPSETDNDPLGLAGKETVSLADLSWEELVLPASSGQTTAAKETKMMAIDAIQHHDFVSLAGTWRNGKGETITISESGQVVYQSYPEVTHFVDLERSRIEGGILHAGITNPEAMASATIPTQFIPAGAVITSVAENGTDPTDQTKDRFFSTQYLMPADILAKETYYRVEE